MTLLGLNWNIIFQENKITIMGVATEALVTFEKPTLYNWVPKETVLKTSWKLLSY